MKSFEGMKLLKVLFVAVCICCGFDLQAGGPWTQKKGEGYFQAGFTTKRWDGSYQGTYADAQLFPVPRDVRESNWMLYGEYGITNRLSFIGDISYRNMQNADEINDVVGITFPTTLEAGSLNAFSNPTLSLKYGLNTSKMVSAVFIRFNPNISVRDAALGLQSDYDAATLGAGVAIGKGWQRSYLQTELALLARANEYGESINGNFQYGYAIRPKTYLIFDLNYQITLENGTYNDGVYALTATFIDNQGYVAYGAKVHSSLFGNFSGNIAAYSGFGIINQGNQPAGIFAGIAYELKKGE